VVVLGIAAFEVTMQPSGSERAQLLLVFGIMAASIAILAGLLARQLPRLRSLRVAVVALAVAAAVVVGVSAAVSARLMFLSVHDLNLLLVALGFGVGLGVVLAVAIADPLAGDLRRIRDTADRVAAGDLQAHTGVDRPDEVGAAAAAIDGMVVQLAEAEEERVRSEESRRHFLAALGHDLRTPLAALRATVEALEDGLAPDPARYLRAMQSDLDAMSHLVDDLFLLATIEAGKLDVPREPVDLAELADDSIEALQPVAGRKDVRLRLETEGGVTVLGGPAALGRVIRNLVDNAIRHAPADSDVVVRVSNGAGALVEVEDCGPGFPPELLDSVFEGFVTGDPARARAAGGAGLGLAIAHGVVTAHGGEIWAAPGPGGRVAFRLPT
jgi:signal transduction histidine kinase